MRKVIISISIILIIWVMISIVFHPAEYLFPSLKNVIKEFINNYKKLNEHDRSIVDYVILLS